MRLNGSLSLKNIEALKSNLQINENTFSYFIYHIFYLVLIETGLFAWNKLPRYIQFMIKLFLKAKYLFFPWFWKDFSQYNALITRCHRYSYYIYSGKTIKISLQSKKFTFVFKVIQNAYTRSYNIIFKDLNHSGLYTHLVNWWTKIFSNFI